MSAMFNFLVKRSLRLILAQLGGMFVKRSLRFILGKTKKLYVVASSTFLVVMSFRITVSLFYERFYGILWDGTRWYYGRGEWMFLVNVLRGYMELVISFLVGILVVNSVVH